jgi:molecular chaperone DnaJ
MGETFYSVLGVSPDADTATIRAAYREKVKTHHPDVSDESDAAERFQRITEARDVLVDDGDRKRYDRMGHDAYVRRHLDSTAWSATETNAGRTRRGDDTDRRNRSGRSGRANGGGESTGAERRRSGRGTRDRSGSGSNADGSGDGTTRGTGDRTRNATGDRRSDARSAASDASTGHGTGDRAAWMGEDGWSTSGDATATASGSSRGTRAEDWQKQHAASNVYSPTGRDAGIGRNSESTRFARLAKGVGPWIVFHFVFLVSAFVTVYLLLSSWPTVPAMFGSLLLLGTAIFFSVLHMVSRIYS